MKTTLQIPELLMKKLKQEAARQGTTMSELVEVALRMLLDSRSKLKTASAPRKLPTFDSGGATVDISDRDALYRVLDRQ